jgi:Ca-activated chloride channel family protein
MKRYLASGLGIGLALWLASAAHGQGLLVVVNPDQEVRLPRPVVIVPHPGPTPVPRPVPEQATYKIKELSVQARLVDQVARVQVSQSFVNTGSQPMEVSFVFPLPYDGAVDQLTLMVDGKEFPAKLLDAKEARQKYEAIVRKNKDPALLEWIGTGMFQTSVFPVPPGAERKVSLRYNQLLRKEHELTDFLFPLSTAKYTSHAVENIEIRLSIESTIEVKNVYSPTHTVEIKRPDDHHATVLYSAKNQIPTSDFRLFYDVAKGQVGASVISYRPDKDEDGFFLLLASPQIEMADEELPKKTVMMVIDRSGSMSGKKIEQAREALKHVVNNLREGDLFNIVAYDSSVESFRPELERYNSQTRQQAIGFVDGLHAGGGTNIEGALKTALGQLKDSSRPNFVIFLTDGLPTVGETNEGKIVASAKEANDVRARLISLGVGYDVNSRLLDRLTLANRGQSEYVRPDEDIEVHVGRIYSRINSPVMTDVAVKFEFDELKTEEGDPINRMFPKENYDLFAGDQLVIVGRYRKPGPAKVTISGSVSGQRQSLDFPAELKDYSSDDSYGFVEKLWAMRRIGDIIDELDLKGKNEELIKELVALSTEHGILTPYTSFLADENTNVRDLATNLRRAGQNLRALDEASGVSGFSQRAEKARFKDAAQVPASQPATPLPLPAGGGAPGRAPAAAGNFGGVAAPAATAPLGPGATGAVVREAKSDKEVLVQGVQNVANKSFYRREVAKQQVWVDSTVTEEMEKKAIRVTQFSDEYFRLADRHGKKLAQYLVFDEPAMVNIEGVAYQIDPAK